MTAKASKPNRYKTLRIRLNDDEWQYLIKQKAKGISYNDTIRSAINAKVKIKLPF
jgi:hypothetical protein